MTKQEIIQVIALLAENYDSFAKRTTTDQQVETMVSLWQECLGDLEYKAVLGAVKKCIIENPYPPTIHDIRKNAVEFINPTVNRTAVEAWEEAYKAISHSAYITKEEFEKLSPEVRKFFGSIRQLQDLGKCSTDEINTVTKGQFLKQYEIIVQRNQNEKLLPKNMRDLLGELANKVGIKELE